MYNTDNSVTYRQVNRLPEKNIKLHYADIYVSERVHTVVSGLYSSVPNKREVGINVLM